VELTKESNLEEELISDLGSLTHDPYKFVLYAFPWGEGELKDYDGPDQWQKDQLIKIRDSLSTNPYEAIKTAVASGHGIGKGCLSSWLILWALSTFEDTRGIITANTETQLKTKSWAELAKWYNLFIAKHLFHLTATAIYSVIPEHSKTWRIDMIPWSEDKSEAFAGLHNQGKRVLLIFDEASSIGNIIWEVSEGAMTDKNTEIIWAVFGNPTRPTGRFRECFKKYKHRWYTSQIDSRDCKMTNKTELDKWINDYGETSDFCKVRVKGQFPSESINSIITEKDMELMKSRHGFLAQHSINAGVALDPSGEGKDFCEFIAGKGGEVVDKHTEPNMAPSVQAVFSVQMCKRIQGNFVAVDCDGIGIGAYQELMKLDDKYLDGIDIIKFHGSSPSDIEIGGRRAYQNQRAEAAFVTQSRARRGIAAIDDNNKELIEDLTEEQYFVNNRGLIQLEDKKDIKERLGRSPGKGDAYKMLQWALEKNIKPAQYEYGNMGTVPMETSLDTQGYEPQTIPMVTSI